MLFCWQSSFSFQFPSGSGSVSPPLVNREMAKCPRSDPLQGKEGEWHGVAPVLPELSSHVLPSAEPQRPRLTALKRSCLAVGLCAFGLW